MTVEMYGYMQLRLVGSQRADMEARLEELAASNGGTVQGRVFCEDGPPIETLWSMFLALDESSGGQMADQLRQIAWRDGVDLKRLLAGGPPTSALWALLDALSRWGGSYVIVPSPDHFDGLGVPRKVLLERISEIDGAVSVLYLDPGTSEARVDRREARLSETHALLGGDRAVLLGKVEVDASGLAVEIVRLSAYRHLMRAGLSDVAEQVDALMGEIIGEAVRFTIRASLATDANRLTVRLLRFPETLVVQVEETREHSDDPISVQVEGLCDRHSGGHVGREALDGGGTLTWFELPLPGYEPYVESEIRRAARRAIRGWP